MIAATATPKKASDENSGDKTGGDKTSEEQSLKFMQIGELADSLQVSTKTLRHYERIGVLPASSRGKNGYRFYTAEAIKQAQTVVALRQLNLPIETIKELLYEGSPDTLRQRLLGALDQKRQEMALEVAILQGKQEDLEARFMRLYQSPDTVPGHCICALLDEPCSCGD